jgi:hypothetical protein
MPPASPQAAVEPPERQLEPSAQPAQQPPATHTPGELPMEQEPDLAMLVQLPPLPQASMVQTFPSSQSESAAHPTQRSVTSLQLVEPPQGSPAWLAQLPPEQVSPPLQKTPSSQRRLLLAC